MIQPRKKAKHITAAGLVLLFLLVTGCAHGKMDAGAGTGALESITHQESINKDSGVTGEISSETDESSAVSSAGSDEAPVITEASAVTGDKPDDVTPPDTAENSPLESTVGSDDFDEFFDDNGSAPVSETPVTALETLVPDPLIGFNRAMFKVNDKLYFWFLKPVAKGYKKVTPEFFRKGVNNFFHNLGTPVRLVSSVLQGKYKGAGSELGRFVVNTTLGVGGVWDPADRFFGLKSSEEDLGQTLGTYNIDNGCYVVWPVLGPSTLRDTVGKAGDFFLNPLYYLSSSELAWGLAGLDTVNNTSYMLGDYETVKSTYMDPYVMIRDLYIEHRKKKISE